MSIVIRGLTYVYASMSEPVVALAGLDLDLPAGSVTVVRGPNGSGKSTLVSILRGHLAPTAGTVRGIDGAQARIATVTQFGNVVPDLTVDEHMAVFGSPGALSDEHAGPSSRAAGSLSRAEQQHLAAQLVHAVSPQLVLADEPAASLSHDDAVGLYRSLAQRCRESGATLVLVTHDHRAEAIADRVVRLRDGRISEVWEPGGPERQAIDSRGWMRLPDNARSRFDSSARVENGVDVVLRGSRGILEPTAPATRSASASGDASVVLVEVAWEPGGAAISAECRRGVITHIAGPAGSGCSELLRIVAGVSSPAEGTVTGTSRGTTLVGSEYPLGQRQSLLDMHVNPAHIAALGLDSMARRPLDTMSGGQRQRALVALALSQTAELVCIDEPTVNMDPDWRERTMAVLRDAAAAGRTIVVATHDDDTIAATDSVIHVGTATART